MNIISNAVKYNKEKGEILLSYYETQVDDRHILFEFHCKDTGVGMSKEFQNHIFEPFTQETGGQDLFMEEQVLVCQLQKN